ncbi:hypothetical protein GOP47_0017211 [Adiantum capillus-veneris]|uniref:Pentatricopeptide repeat-containing protein n=1 Tax=Adiantum capillus-veneris TaxID=13818 RepID=A0A9D4UK36_ADICA|nr:hypothetical protein GOP47_0017211 [Adiantum capillus-veneris]
MLSNLDDTFNHSLELPPFEKLPHTLQDCLKKKNLTNAWTFYMLILANGLEFSNILRDYIVFMFARCGSLLTAKKICHRLTCNNGAVLVHSIHMLVKCGEFQKAINVFETFDTYFMCADEYLYQTLLKACGIVECAHNGKNIHCDIVKKGFDLDSFVGTNLIDMYAKNGMLEEAQIVFEKLLVKDVVSWSSLICGYAENGCGERAIQSFSQMNNEGVIPNAVTFMCGLKACGHIGNLDKGRDIYADLAKQGYEKDLCVVSALVSMYIYCGCIKEAQAVFDGLPLKDVVLWTTLVGGYAERGHDREALMYLEKMQAESSIPNAVTSVCGLKACGNLGSFSEGRAIHNNVMKHGFDDDEFVITALMDMYINCRLLHEAQNVFDKLAVKSRAAWNVLIGGLVDHNCGQEALERFKKMQSQGPSPDRIAFVCALKACNILGLVNKGQSLHMEIVKAGLEKNIIVGVSVLDLYSKCGSVEEAEVVFGTLSIRSVVSWNALIMGYAQHGYGEKALSSVSRMDEEGVPIDATTAVCGLKACLALGELNRGMWIHMQAEKQALIMENPVMGSALIDMYVKCNSLLEARNVFDGLVSKDVISWGTLLSGYACQGDYELVSGLFDEMQESGLLPDGVPLLSVLTVCCHAGLTQTGLMALNTLNKEYAIPPTLEHYNCMIDVLGRAGQLDETVAMLNEMPFQPDLVSWKSLLSSCRKCGDIAIAKHAFEHASVLTENKLDLSILMQGINVENY